MAEHVHKLHMHVLHVHFFANVSIIHWYTIIAVLFHYCIPTRYSAPYITQY